MHLRGGHLHLDFDAVVPAEGDDRQGPSDGRPQIISSKTSAAEAGGPHHTGRGGQQDQCREGASSSFWTSNQPVEHTL